MKKVFLIGDIGDGKGGYYHIGDELMFFYNYKILKKYGYKIFVSSRSSQTRYKNVVLDIDFSGTFRFVKLIIILLLFKLYPSHSRIKKIINTICSVNSIIFSGGGNLNSIRKGHLYYRFLITYFAKKFKKDVYLSAQTIGPIYGKLDYKILNYILSYCKIIGVRDVNFSINYINDEFKRKVRYFCDDIFIGSKNIKNREIKSLHDGFNVGISLHSNGDDRNLFEQLFQIKIILESLHGKIKFYRIPHVFDKFGGYDEDFMKSINFIKYENTFKPGLYKSNIENLYKKMDIVITTRYHGGALAIKYGKPAIMIGRDLYELGKFNGLFDSLHIKNCIILSKSDKIDVKDIKSIIIKRSNNITYNENQNFIFNYIKNYDKSRINKNSGTKKH